ncbi:MAG: glycoside hydrolase family 15 protein, partial [Candidatus Nanopelagicales bacterium]|nr:glycoside hydrolase family 15 protein [Candidatus Nanopelagicales bacterium]
MSDYLPIEDHGLIGDLQTAALVGKDGTIDWFCAPRFDSPSIFGSILDADDGGHFRLTVTEPNPVIKQLYMIDTAVLLTRYLTEAGVAEVLDFMPIDQPKTASDTHEIFRLARVVRGEITFSMECSPRFDYGRAEHELTLTDHHALFTSDDIELSLHATAKLSHAGGKHRRNGVARSEFTLKEGENSGFILSTGPVGREAGTLAPERVTRMLNDTINYWRTWVNRGTYVGRWREMVNRSAVTIKLLTYAPTGAMVAAPTTSLPEKVGGPRNWDYRFSWVRDSSFALTALIQLGYTDEVTEFLKWLAERVATASNHPSGPLKLMYRIDGRTDLVEEDLTNFEGYERSAPVRIGNGAVDQLQLDIYGEALDAVYQMSKAGRLLGHDAWMDIVSVTNWLAAHWDQPDEGIWETRGGRK